MAEKTDERDLRDGNDMLIPNGDEVREHKQDTVCIRVKTFILNNFLMVSLVIFVIIGIVLPQPGHALDHRISKYICIIYIFLCSGLYLRTKEMKEALMAYKAVIWGVISILGVTSIIGGQLTKLLIRGFYITANLTSNNSLVETQLYDTLGPVELRYGLIVYLIMPCTISSGIVLVNQLNGHLALAVLLTVSTNLLAVVTVPLYTKWLLTSDVNISFDIPSLLLKLVITVLLPMLVGKSFSLIKKIKDWSTQPTLKLILKKISTLCLVFIVWFKVSTTSINGDMATLSVLSVVFVIGWGLLTHVMFLVINYVTCLILRLETQSLKCVVILASQKTMALAVTVMTFLPTDLGKIGLIALAIILAHVSILLFDSLLIAVWLYWERRKSMEKQSRENDDEAMKNTDQ